MCGIGGVWGSAALPDPARLAQVFGDALAHRGPDGEGFLGLPCADEAPVRYADRHIAAPSPLSGLLVHRRLSIIDLATGDQPMAIDDGRYWIVFNGEIYNFPAIRATLETSGVVFRTTSDTEVILHVYRRWGIEGFQRLNGIFALALYDATRRELVLARDPVGVKPLYWTRGPWGVAFASEIRPLVRAGFADREVSRDGLAQYLFYRFVPAPATVWKDVHKVEPGHALRFGTGGVLREDRDFAAPPPALDNGWQGDVADKLAPRLMQAVRRQMLSDVPVGAFLSGGLDSSLVVSSLGETAKALPTFAVGFPGEPGHPSELVLARRAAAVLRTRHEEEELRPDAYFERLPWAIAQVEEPLAHPGMLLQADLSAFARRRVKVVLTGQGADEPLGGYPRHHAARVLPLFAGILGPAARSGWVRGWGARRESVARVRRVLLAPPGVERAASLFSPLGFEDAAALVRGVDRERARAAILGGIEPWWQRAAGMDDVARTLYVDVRTSLAEDLLLVADKMSMAHGLEVRVPFLDLEYLAALEAIPGAERVRVWGTRKRIQHAIGRRVLPASLSRSLATSSSPLGRKRAFDVPVAEWFRGSFREGLTKHLLGPESVLPAYLDGDRVKQIVGSFGGGAGGGYRLVLSLFVLEHWLRGCIAGRAPAAPPT